MDKKITKIIFRQDDIANMKDVVLAKGEPAIAFNGTTYDFKIGDAIHTFENLPVIRTDHVITEPIEDGEYLRKKQGDVYSWVTIEDSRKTLADLLVQPYGEELDMGYDMIDPSNTTRRVFGIRKSFIVSINANQKVTNEITSDIYSIIECGGYVVAGNDGRVSVTSGSDLCKSEIYVTPENKLNVSTVTKCDRLDNLIDVWVLYTKVQ